MVVYTYSPFSNRLTHLHSTETHSVFLLLLQYVQKVRGSFGEGGKHERPLRNAKKANSTYCVLRTYMREGVGSMYPPLMARSTLSSPSSSSSWLIEGKRAEKQFATPFAPQLLMEIALFPFKDRIWGSTSFSTDCA